MASGINIRSTRADGASHLAFGVPSAGCLSLVVQLFAFSECQSQLRHSLTEVQLQRYQRQPLTFNRPNQSTDLLAVEQQLTCSLCLVIGVTAPFIRSDMHVDKEDLTITNVAIRVRDVG